MNKFKNCISLFLAFFKIGLITFGGGYAMVAIIENELVEKKRWIEKNEFLDVIAIAESTPGPIAINSATFIGYKRGGFWGSFFSTLGVVLPSLVIILLIASVIKGLLKYAGVNAFLSGIRPVVVGLIAATGACMALSVICGIGKIGDAFRFDYKAAVIFVAVALTAFVYKKIKKKRISAIYLILLSAVLGMIFYGLLG